MTGRTALLIGNYRPAFILAQSLKKRGYQVICGLDGYDRGAEVSRFVDKVWKHSSYQGSPGRFQDELTSLLKRHPGITDVYPVAEPVIRAIAEGRLSLPSHVRVGSMNDALVRRCLDKKGLLTTARHLSIPVAPFAETGSREDFYRLAEEIGFPLVIRPLETGKVFGAKKAITCIDMEAVFACEEIWQESGYQLLVQSHVTGKRDNIYFAARGGEIYRYLHAKIIRTDQPDGSGLAVEGKTVTPCTKLDGYTRKLVEALNYDGIGCAQYLVDADSGDISFLELNPRIAGNHALPEACGMGLGDWLIDTTEKCDQSEERRVGAAGVQYSWIAGELDAIRNSWRTGRLGLLQALKGGWQAILSFRRDDLDMGLVPGDLMPGLITLCDSLPVVGTLTRRRFDNAFLFKVFIRKECIK